MTSSESKSSSARNNLLLFYVVAFLWFSCTILWHFSAAAAKLPQAHDFGWFFKYLTFCGFILQTFSLFFCLLAYLLPQSEAVKRAADDLGCSVFTIANVITVMHWVLYFTTAMPVDGGVQARMETTVTRSSNIREVSPLWLNLTVHLANSAVAWVDVNVSERTFGKGSLQKSLVFCFLYTIWIQVCAAQNKMYPYPFLNVLPQPAGIAGATSVAVALACVFFKIGTTLANVQNSRAKLKAQ